MGSQHADSPSAGGRNDLPWTDYGISEENRNALDDRQCDPGSLLRHFHQNLVQGIYAGLLGLALGYVAYRYGTLFASMLMHLLYNLFGTVLIDIESSIMPDWMLGLLIFLCVPLTVVGIVLVYIKTVNTDKKQESKI